MQQDIVVRTPKAIVTKALYSKLLGFERTDNEADLCVDLDTEDLDHLLTRYIFRYGPPPGIRSARDFKLLRQEFSIALRHKEDQYDLCLEVARQSLEKGLPYVTFAVSSEARELKEFCKEVIVEVNRAKGLRFSPHSDARSIYWAEYNIYHETADLILKYFAKRYPMRCLVIYGKRSVYWYKDKQTYSQDNSLFSLSSNDKKYEEKAYYAGAR